MRQQVRSTGSRNNTSLGQIDEDLFHTIRQMGNFRSKIWRWNRLPYRTMPPEPVAYRLDNGEKSVAVVTDLGLLR